MSPDLLSARTTKSIVLTFNILAGLLLRGVIRGCGGWGGWLCGCALFTLHARFFEHFAAFAAGADFGEAFAVVLADKVDWVFAIDESVCTERANVNFILEEEESEFEKNSTVNVGNRWIRARVWGLCASVRGVWLVGLLFLLFRSWGV